MDGQPARQTPAEQTRNSPYLRGDEVRTDSGPLLSVFGLQEILAKVRDAQTRLQMSAGEAPPTPPDIQTMFDNLHALANERSFRIERQPTSYYRHQAVQSDERIFQINRFYEQISAIGSTLEGDDAQQLLETVLRRIQFVRDQGSFIIHDLPTYFENGIEIISRSALGLDVEEALTALNNRERAILDAQLRTFRILNRPIQNVYYDLFNAAMPDPVYNVHQSLTNYVVNDQRDDYRRAQAWLRTYSDSKGVTYDRNLQTDIFSPDTMYILSYTLPPNPSIIWSLPRCGISNLMLNAAIGLPMGQYILPNSKIASVTITARITQNSPLSQVQATTATEAQMHDVRKIYLALMFPNQILLDIKTEPGHSVDQVVNSVAGVIGKIMFTYGPRLFNVTSRTAHILDRACSDFLTSYSQQNVRFNIRSRAPFDWTATLGTETFDGNRLRMDPISGRGYNGYRANDLRNEPTCYPHVSRRVCYTGYDSTDILDERFSGSEHMYPTLQEMMSALRVTGHTQERSYLYAMSQHHIVRFAYLNQIINRDLLSAFSLPDDLFNELTDRIPLDELTANGPIILDISMHSIWHAYKMRFLPTEHSSFQLIQPLIESIFSSQISVMKLNAVELRNFTIANPDSFPNLKAMDVWRAVYANMPESIRAMMDLAGQHWFITAYDCNKWMNNPEVQISIPYRCMSAAWRCLDDANTIMLTRDVYIHRTSIPELAIEDIEEFRRRAEFFTNVASDQPPAHQRVYLPVQAAIHRAGEGRFKIYLRALLDEGYYVRIGSGVRPLVLEIHNKLPSRDVLERLPYSYQTTKSDGPVAKFSFSTTGRVNGILIMYSADDHSTPDEMVNVNPTYCNTLVILKEMPFSRVETSSILNVVNRDLIAIKKKTRIYDLTEALTAGNRQAIPSTE
nr:VP2 [Umatilla virus]